MDFPGSNKDKSDSILNKITSLDADVRGTIREAQDFLRILEEYHQRLIELENEFLSMREKIEQGQFSNLMEARLTRIVEELEELVSQETKKKLLNKMQLILNFEKFAVKEGDRMIIEAFQARIKNYQDLLH